MKIEKFKPRGVILIKDINDIIKRIKEEDLNVYRGGYEGQNYAEISSSKKVIKTEIVISYESIWECKKVEDVLRQYCTDFYPRKFGKTKSIGTSKALQTELQKLKKDTESFETVIWRLLLEHYDMLD